MSTPTSYACLTGPSTQATSTGVLSPNQGHRSGRVRSARVEHTTITRIMRTRACAVTRCGTTRRLLMAQKFRTMFKETVDRDSHANREMRWESFANLSTQARLGNPAEGRRSSPGSHSLTKVGRIVAKMLLAVQVMIYETQLIKAIKRLRTIKRNRSCRALKKVNWIRQARRRNARGVERRRRRRTSKISVRFRSKKRRKRPVNNRSPKLKILRLIQCIRKDQTMMRVTLMTLTLVMAFPEYRRRMKFLTLDQRKVSRIERRTRQETKPSRFGMFKRICEMMTEISTKNRLLKRHIRGTMQDLMELWRVAGLRCFRNTHVNPRRWTRL